MGQRNQRATLESSTFVGLVVQAPVDTLMSENAKLFEISKSALYRYGAQLILSGALGQFTHAQIKAAVEASDERWNSLTQKWSDKIVEKGTRRAVEGLQREAAQLDALGVPRILKDEK